MLALLLTLAVQEAPRPVDTVRAEAEKLLDSFDSPLARTFLRATVDLPEIEGTRVVYWNRGTGAAFAEEDAEDRDLESFQKLELGEKFHYNTFYGTPVAYARALEYAARHGLASVDGERILDFGYGGIGHLYLLASLGANVVGVEVMELLKVYYTGADGPVARSSVAGEGEDGRVTLLHGHFPADENVVRAVGGGYRLVMSKNVLKKGYVHPEREVDPRRTVQLGVDDETFVRTVFTALEPGGLFVIYNLYPKPSAPDEEYKPWASGECPFARELCESVGFEVLAFDLDDNEGARSMGVTLGWREADSPDDLFGMVTVMRKPAR